MPQSDAPARGAVSSPVPLGEIVAALETRYDPRWAADWDAVGLVCGDPHAAVDSVLFAVDPVESVVDEAIARGAGLLVTHHPLFLTAVHGVPATDPKGRLVHRLIRAGCGLYVAHTNADVASPGVSDALAAAFDLRDIVPLVPAPTDPLDTVVTFVPLDAVEHVIDALSAAGAGAVGDYSRCAFGVVGEGTFRPGPGSTPTVGTVGEVARVPETRVELVLPRARRAAVLAALRASHPYEEPAYSLLELAVGVDRGRGTGRVGVLPRPERLADFGRRVAAALPATAVGIRATGDPDAWIETVAVCGGSGGSYIDAAQSSGAHAYVTADLRHHPASEALQAPSDPLNGSTGGAAPLDHTAHRPMSLLDVTHWASEWPFLPMAARLLDADLAAVGATVSTRVSTIVTDPWTLHVPSRAHQP